MIDGDGYYSASIIYKYLKYINPHIRIEPLFHKDKIHGLKEQYIIDKVIQDKPNLIICPDSATGDFEECKTLKENNIDVLILDHHPIITPNEYAVVINNKLSPNVINKAGSGALVTWKFCKYIDQKLGLNYAPKLIDLVYFSLLSDICDMNTLENRAFAYWGKVSIKNKLLVTMCDKLLKDKEINNHNISWYVQPKISDIIRCDDEEIKQDLFYALAEEKPQCIDNVLNNYSAIHTHRKDYVQEYFDSMDSIDENNNIIFEKVENLYPYYTGLVASKINNKYNKPCILYRDSGTNKIIGSVRSPFPIKQQLANSGVFDWQEGHDSACGCQFDISNMDKVKKFVETIELDDSVVVTQSFDGASLIPKYLFQEFTEHEDIWGQAIPKPIFHIHNIKLKSSDIRIIGKNKTTISFEHNGIKYIKFMCSHEWIDENISGFNDLNIEIIGYFGLNIYRGYVNYQIEIGKIEVQKHTKKLLNIDSIF